MRGAGGRSEAERGGVGDGMESGRDNRSLLTLEGKRDPSMSDVQARGALQKTA